jgi:hypothetical protein
MGRVIGVVTVAIAWGVLRRVAMNEGDPIWDITGKDSDDDIVKINCYRPYVLRNQYGRLIAITSSDEHARSLANCHITGLNESKERDPC